MSGRAQTIVGSVLDDLNSAPLFGTAVMLLDSTDTAVRWAESDSTGRFFLNVPRSGRYRLYADRLGYSELLSDTFALRQDGPVELELRMVPMPLELETVVVTAEHRRAKLDRQGFYRRKDRSMGHFFDMEDIQTINPMRTSDLLRRVPGVVVRPNRIGGTVATTWRGAAPCPMKIVLDGYKLDLSDDALDNWVSADEVIGVEVFPGGVGAPVQHRGTDAFCGVIMIWTR
jgi:hypothetical protein